MNLTKVLDGPAMLQIAGIAMAVTQYIKEGIPEKLIPVVNILVGIGASFLWFYDPSNGNVDFVVIIANGVLAAVTSDTAYNFLSATNSSPFTLPSKKNGTVVERMNLNKGGAK